MKIMGTGSRSMITDPNALSIYQSLEEHILFLKQTHGDITLISGMAEGWDEAIAKIGMRNNIPYIVAIPNPTYGEYYWRDHSLLKVNRIATFRELVANAAEIVIVSNRVYVNGLHANFVRNQWMVDHSDAALVYNPSSAGTRDAIARLQRAGVRYEVYPFDKQGILAYGPNTIDSFDGPFRFLSNFAPSPFVFNGVQYPTVEHAFQAAKAISPQQHDEIAQADTPGMAKRLGRKVNLRADWMHIRDEIMYALVKEKFTQNEDLAIQLDATGDTMLIEGNTWGDTYWGVCNGVGENKLGQILMRVRSEIRS